MGDHDLLYADVAGAVYDTANFLRRNMTGSKNGVILLDKRENAAQLRKRYTSVIRHANTAASAVLVAVIFRVHCRQPNDLGAHFKGGLYRFGIQSARLII